MTEIVEQGPATVFYIEDDLSNLGVVKILIGQLRPHWRFLAARDGRGGVETARAHRPDCILLALQLPGINGDQVLSELRAHVAKREIPVLLVRADVMSRGAADVRCDRLFTEAVRGLRLDEKTGSSNGPHSGGTNRSRVTRRASITG